MSNTVESSSAEITTATIRASGWINLGFSRSFVMKRLLQAIVALSAMGACVALEQGVLGFVVLAILVWPFPFRFTLDERGLQVSWFAFKEWIPWAEMVRAEIEDDSRRWVIGRRPEVLRIYRREEAPVTLLAERAALEKLGSAITARLAARGESAGLS
jgi:hypothetical protein